MTDNNARESTMVEPVRRRRFTKQEKAVIVAEYAAAATSTERGMVLRRHGTFQQNVSRWTKELNMTTKPAKTASREEVRLAKQLAAAEAKLAAANAEVALLEELVAAQGKVLGLHAKKPGSPHQG
jgi:transposase-like protein